MGKEVALQEVRLQMDKILTTSELAAYLRLNDATVSRMAASGVLPGFKFGKAWRFDRDELLRWLDEMKPKVKAAP